MGYRSQVGYLILFTDKGVYDQFKVQYRLDSAYDACRQDEVLPDSEGTYYSAHLRWDDDNMRVIFNGEDLKWYDDYEDVISHEKLLELADEYAEKYSGVSWQFVRVGEDSSGDIETRGDSSGTAGSYIYPVSSIQWDL